MWQDHWACVADICGPCWFGHHLGEIELASKVSHRKQGLVWGVADMTSMLKSPTRTVDLSLVGWMSERADPSHQ